MSAPESPISACCNAPLISVGSEDFGGENDVVTCYWECTKCKNPADPNPVEGNYCEKHHPTIKKFGMTVSRKPCSVCGDSPTKSYSPSPSNLCK